jgi:benzylsuccinate CoA-transferase BbsE subunit
MTELLPAHHDDPDAPLRGVRVLEIEGEFTGYAGKLLADLGAEVMLLAPVSAEYGFDARRFFQHHTKSPVDEVTALSDLLREVDVVLQSAATDESFASDLDPVRVRTANPAVVHVVITPFGLSGPKATAVSTDLVRLAAGGLLWLGGYPDSEPMAPYGEQSTVGAAIYAAVAVLLALITRERTGEGDTIEVSSQELVTQALETSLSEYELLGKVRRRLGDRPREAGTGIFPCADGHVSMVAGRLGTAAAWKRLVEWLQETGTDGAAVLSGPGWDTLEHRQRPESIAEFTAIFGHFAAARSKSDLYTEGQTRGIAIAPVNTVADVLADRQLKAREFFVQATDPETGAKVLLPGTPFRLSRATAAVPEPA